MTLKELSEKLIKEIAEIEKYTDADGHLPESFCHWILCSRTQRLSEISQGLDLSGTQGFENKGCYRCTLENPVCSAYQRSSQHYFGDKK